MAIVPVDGAVDNSNNGGALALNTNAIVGLADGDFMLAIWAGFNRSAGVGALTDELGRTWNEILNTTIGNNRVRIAWLFATSDDTTNTITVDWAATGNNADGTACALRAWRNVDAASPISATIQTATATSTNPDPPSITPAHDDCAIIAGYASSVIDGSPGTVTNYDIGLESAGNDTNDAQVQFCWRILTGGNGVPEDPPAFSSYSSSTWLAFSLALKPGAVVHTADVTESAALADAALSKKDDATGDVIDDFPAFTIVNNDWQGTTMRAVISPDLLNTTYAGTISVKFEFATGSNGSIADAFIGHNSGGDEYDFEAAPTRLTFDGGSNGKTISGAMSVESDDVVFSYDATKKLVVSIAFTGTKINLLGYGF